MFSVVMACKLFEVDRVGALGGAGLVQRLQKRRDHLQQHQRSSSFHCQRMHAYTKSADHPPLINLPFRQQKQGWRRLREPFLAAMDHPF